MSFQIGDKVVCIQNTWKRPDLFSEVPIKGRIYAIRGIGTQPAGPEAGEPGCYLVGIYGRFNVMWQMEYGFLQRAFRKLDELKAESREAYYREHPEPKPLSAAQTKLPPIARDSCALCG
jgi:hypothetical protein